MRSRLVNFIAVGGVMFGVAVLIIVTSVMDGFRHKVMSVVRGNLADVIMVPNADELPRFEPLAEHIQSDPRVVSASPVVRFPVFFLHNAGSRGRVRVEGYQVHEMQAEGIDWPRERLVSEFRIAELGPDGAKCKSTARSKWKPPPRTPICILAANDPERPFHSERAIDYERVGAVMVSRTFLEKFYGLGMHPDWRFPSQFLEYEIGITFIEVEDSSANGGGNVAGRSRTVQLPISAVYDSEETGQDLVRIFLEKDTLRRIAGIQDEYHEIRVRLNPGVDARAVKADFTKRYPGHLVGVWQDQRAVFLRAVNNEKVLLAIVLSFIVLLGGFIILATLTLTVVEKTKDIGVLAALGATRGGILRMFVSTGLLIGILGATLGVGLGYLFLNNINDIKAWLKNTWNVDIFPADIYLFREIPVIWDWAGVLTIAIGSVIVAFFSGFIPAFRASRMDPVKALRYE